MDSFSERLRAEIALTEPRLRGLTETGEVAASGERWSARQELGHLVDSATNNRVRFIRAALEGQFTGPSYNGRGWVEMGGYAEMAWPQLVDTWVLANRALAMVIERIPDGRMSGICRVGEYEPVTLDLLIEDYLRHMRHHLDHILGVAAG